MKIDDLVQQVKTDKETGHFSLQAIINRHIEDIEALKKEGYAYLKLFELFDLGIKSSHFQTMISRARKAVSAETGQTPKQVLQEGGRGPTLPEEQEKTSCQSEQAWYEHTNIKIPGRLILDLEKAGLGFKDINELGLTSASQIRKYLTEMSVKSKYK